MDGQIDHCRGGEKHVDQIKLNIDRDRSNYNREEKELDREKREKLMSVSVPNTLS